MDIRMDGRYLRLLRDVYAAMASGFLSSRVSYLVWTGLLWLGCTIIAFGFLQRYLVFFGLLWFDSMLERWVSESLALLQFDAVVCLRWCLL
jgi:hypothetical protein